MPTASTPSNLHGGSQMLAAQPQKSSHSVAPKFPKTKSQLKRSERVSIFGLDCVDCVHISGWTVGREVQKTITIKNVSLTTQKLNYELPQTECFDMSYPQGWKFAPGTTVQIKIFFRPIEYKPYIDYVTVITPTGQFSILLKATINELALSIPPFIDFGIGPIKETVVIPVPIHNTGGLPLRYEWAAARPFGISKISGCEGSIPVGGMTVINMEFSPSEAKMYEGLARVQVFEEREGGVIVDDDTKLCYAMQVFGTGKVPHLVVQHGGPPEIDFGGNLPGVLNTKKLVLQNVTAVRATVQLTSFPNDAVNRELQVGCPIQPAVRRFIIEPGDTFDLNFSFSSTIIGECVSRQFQLTTPGGAPMLITTRGYVKPAQVAISTSYINFGDLDCSEDPAKVYARAQLLAQGKDPGMKVLRIDNKSNIKVHFHFVNADQLYSVFTFETPCGTIAPGGFALIRVNFTPLAPINYYQRYYCIIKNGPLEALYVDLLGTGYNEMQRPATLQEDHVLLFRQMQLSGQTEYCYKTKRQTAKPWETAIDGHLAGSEPESSPGGISPTVVQNTIANTKLGEYAEPMDSLRINDAANLMGSQISITSLSALKETSSGKGKDKTPHNNTKGNYLGADERFSPDENSPGKKKAARLALEGGNTNGSPGSSASNSPVRNPQDPDGSLEVSPENKVFYPEVDREKTISAITEKVNKRAEKDRPEDGEHGSPLKGKQSPKKNYHNFLDRIFPVTVKKPKLSATQTMLECMYTPKDVTIDPPELDFSVGGSGSHQFQRTLTLRNNTTHKITAVWMLPRETRRPCSFFKYNECDNIVFTVYPNNIDISAKSEQEFTVYYRPSKELTFDGGILECYVNYKRNRAFRLVDLKKFTPPWCLTVTCTGHTMGAHRDDCRVEIAVPDVIRMKPVALMQRSYHVFLIKNKGDTKMSYKILNAQSIDGAEDTGGAGDNALSYYSDAATNPFQCYPRRGTIYPHSFHCIIVQFAPTVVQNEKDYKARFPVVINYEDQSNQASVPGGYRYVNVRGRCWQPTLDVKPLVYFPDTCQGIKSILEVDVRNVSEIPVLYEVKIPSKFRDVFSLENIRQYISRNFPSAPALTVQQANGSRVSGGQSVESSFFQGSHAVSRANTAGSTIASQSMICNERVCYLGPGESGKMTIAFTPPADKVFDTAIYVTAVENRSYSDDDRIFCLQDRDYFSGIAIDDVKVLSNFMQPQEGQVRMPKDRVSFTDNPMGGKASAAGGDFEAAKSLDAGPAGGDDGDGAKGGDTGMAAVPSNPELSPLSLPLASISNQNNLLQPMSHVTTGQTVGGPERLNCDRHPLAKKVYAVQLVGVGQCPILSVEHQLMDFGPVVAWSDEKFPAQLKLYNNGMQTVHYRIEAEFQWHKVNVDCSPIRKEPRSGYSSPRSNSQSPSRLPSRMGSARKQQSAGKAEGQKDNLILSGSPSLKSASTRSKYTYVTPTVSINNRASAGGGGLNREALEDADGLVPTNLFEDERTLFEDCIFFEEVEGSVGPRCSTDIKFKLWPQKRGWHEWKVRVVPIRHHHKKVGAASGGHHGHPQQHGGKEQELVGAAEFTVCADVQYSLVQISDVRQESGVSQPLSMLWNYFQVDSINKLLRRPVDPVDRKYQRAMGIDQRKALIPQLTSFQLNFGTSPYGNQPTTVYLVFTNPGDLPVTYNFQSPGDLQLSADEIPYWHDEIPFNHRLNNHGRTPGTSDNPEAVMPKTAEDKSAMAERHYDWVENHKIFEIYPKTATVAPGEFIFVRCTYQHYSVGTHILPFVFSCEKGKSMVFYAKAHTLPPNVGRLSVRATEISLRPVPIGYERGPLQVVELSNCGAVSATWRIDTESLDELCKKNYGFRILDIQPREGILDPQSAQFIHVCFTPIEQKEVTCPIKIELLRDNSVIECLEFDIHGQGFDPRYTTPKYGSFYPSTLPIQTYAPIPGYGAALSCEAVDFGIVPLNSINTKVISLVNYSKESQLRFKWSDRNLFRGEFEILPPEGVLKPGGHQLLVFRLHCIEGPIELAGDVECRIEWIPKQSDLPKIDEEEEARRRQQEESEQVEFFAHHSQIVHEAAYDPKSFVNKHISVVHRLTVSRFRALMSTPAGQKYLNQSLDRTALLSSHLPVATPRSMYKKMQDDFNASQTQGSMGSFNMTGGSSLNATGHNHAGHNHGNTTDGVLAAFPMYVRVSAGCRADIRSEHFVTVQKEKYVTSCLAGGPGEKIGNQEDSFAQLKGVPVSALSSMSIGPSVSQIPSYQHESQHGTLHIQSSALNNSALLVNSLPNASNNAAAIQNPVPFEYCYGVLRKSVQNIVNSESFNQILYDARTQDSSYYIQMDPTGRPNKDQGLAEEARRKQLEEDSKSKGSKELKRIKEQDPMGGSGQTTSAPGRGTNSTNVLSGETVRHKKYDSSLILDFNTDNKPDFSAASSSSRPQERRKRPIVNDASDSDDDWVDQSEDPYVHKKVNAKDSRPNPGQGLKKTSTISNQASAHSPSMVSLRTTSGVKKKIDRNDKTQIIQAERHWKETREKYGEVELDNYFKNCSSNVLQHLVLQLVDNTISGKENWAKLNL